MFILISISCASDVQTDLFDEVWFITNTTPKIPIGAVQHKELAPKEDSFFAYKAGRMSLEALLGEYDYMLREGKYNTAIERLLNLNSQGKWIQLVCYCKDLQKCHRYVLFKYLTELIGKDVTIL